MSRAALLFAIAGGACGGAAAVKPPPADHHPAPITLAPGERLGLLLRGAEAPYQVTRATPPFVPMPFTLASGPGGSIGHGDQLPKISPDGRWVAEARDGVWLRALDGSGDHQITRHGEDEIELLLGGWSPDSQSFLFYQAEAMREDESPPFPPDEQPGFQLASVKDFGHRRIDLAGFDVWDVDSQHVLYVDQFGDAPTGRLVRADLVGGAPVDAGLCEGCSQLERVGGTLAYLRGAGVAYRPIDGSAPEVMLATGGWAEYQWGTLSPSGAMIAVAHRVNDVNRIEVTATAGAPALRPVHTCASLCDHAWHTDGSLWIVDGGKVTEVTLDGAATPIADDAATLITQ